MSEPSQIAEKKGAAQVAEPYAADSVPVVYLAHPAGAATREQHLANLARAKRWFAWAARQGVAVVADWIIYCEVWDDFDPAQRWAGLAHDDAQIRRCDEVWMVGGRVSGGMARGRETAKAAGVPAVDLTFLGEEPPRQDDRGALASLGMARLAAWNSFYAARAERANLAAPLALPATGDLVVPEGSSKP